MEEDQLEAQCMIFDIIEEVHSKAVMGLAGFRTLLRAEWSVACSD
jgi:hypothetical protein